MRVPVAATPGCLPKANRYTALTVISLFILQKRWNIQLNFMKSNEGPKTATYTAVNT